MTDKNKNILLLLGFLILILVSYKFAFSKTLNLKNQYQALKHEAILYENTPRKLSLLRQKQVHYDSILSKYQIDGSSIQNNLLKTINNVATLNDLKVINFSEPHILQQNDLIIKTYEFTVEGSYNNIITLVYKLEQQTKFGEIINLQFEKKKNYRTNKYYLQAKVLLKSFS